MSSLLENRTQVKRFLFVIQGCIFHSACFSVSRRFCFLVSHCLLLYTARPEQLSNYARVTAVLPLGPFCYAHTQVINPGMVTFLACEGLAMWLDQLASTAGSWVTPVNLTAWQWESERDRWNGTLGALSPKSLALDCEWTNKSKETS